MSLVLIWPSTVIRLKEASTARRSAASGSSTTASVCTKQSIVAMFGSIIPPPFAWAESGDAVDLQRAALRPAVGGHDRLGEDERRRRRRVLGGGGSIPGSTRAHRHRHADHAGLGDGDLGGLQAERVGRPFGHRERVGEALLAGLGVGVAGVDDRGADVGPVDDVAADPDRRRGGGVAGEDEAPSSTRSASQTSRPTSVLPPPFSPTWAPPGAEAGRELRRVELLDPGGRVDPARPEEGADARRSASARRRRS